MERSLHLCCWEGGWKTRLDFELPAGGSKESRGEKLFQILQVASKFKVIDINR
jgi:hypothetical protein